MFNKIMLHISKEFIKLYS